MSEPEAYEGPTVVGSGRGRAADAGSRLAIGEVFGPYRVLSFLGRGGIGEVFEVEHEALQKRFAMKLLLASADSADARARFIREARVMAALEHERIIRVDDFGETNGKVWLRMELAEGVPGRDGRPARTLAEWIAERGHRLPELEAKAALIQILDALEFAHAAGVVHRDLKPGNILLDRAGRLKIADFGLVQIIDERWARVRRDPADEGALDSATTVVHGAEPETENAVMGTWEFMSPEQKAGGPVDARSDLYAAGLIAFRLLTGERALALESPSELAPGLDPGWDDWIRQAVATRPERRFANAAAMRASLPGLDRAAEAEPAADENQTRVADASAPAPEAAGKRSRRAGFARAWRTLAARFRKPGRASVKPGAIPEARSDKTPPARPVAENPEALRAIKRVERMRTGRFRAAILNLFLPGLGSVLRGQPLLGTAFAAVAIAIAGKPYWWGAGAVAMAVALFDIGKPPLSPDDRRLLQRVRRFQVWYIVFTVLSLLVLGAGATIVLAELGHVDAPDWLPRPDWTRSILADLAVMAGLLIVALRASAMLWSIVGLKRALTRGG